MVSLFSTPKAPDPTATANAQAQYNKQTGQSQTELNSMNQVTPYGNLTYNQSGTWDDGTPKYTATQTLSPEQQKLYNLSTQTQTNLGQAGVTQSDQLAKLLSTPLNLDAATGKQQADIWEQLYNPVWNTKEAQFKTDLTNRGITPGTEAYTNAIRDFGMERDNAYNSALLSSRSQGVNEALQQRNQPFNEMSAVQNGAQVTQPNFINTTQSQVQPVDYTGLVNNQYQSQMASQAALWGAIGQMGGAALGGWGYGGFKMK